MKTESSDVMGGLLCEWLVSKEVPNGYAYFVPMGSIAFALDEQQRVDLDVVLGRGKANEECVVYNRFVLEESQRVGFGVGADWWFEAYLNGERLWSTMELDGNGTQEFSPLNHPFVGMGKKGENLLAIRVRRGSGDSWMFSAGALDAAEADPFRPVTVTVDASHPCGAIKRMNAVNNGPIPGLHTQTVSNMREWQALKIPFARNHDASFYSGYGGEHSVDVHMIFPDFSKDPADPASYVFGPTDRYLSAIQEGGTKVFYRLGSKIEHRPYKCGTRVPPDFQKWAVICEHIVRHYTEGWADGFRWDIAYWEIWNEPDLSFGPGQKPTWQGSEREYFDLYRVAATHLKKCFPHLKIGGPATFLPQWSRGGFTDRFLEEMKRGEPVPVDFFSWHQYTVKPHEIGVASRLMREALDDHGYTATESILDEWNYVRSFEGKAWHESLQAMVSLRGAVFVAASMSAAQEAPVDMLMYYDARPCGMNGLFHQVLLTPLKGYYAFLAWAKLAELGTQIPVDLQQERDLFATAATDGHGAYGLLLTRYSDDPQREGEREVSIRIPGVSLWGAKVFLLDETHDLTEIPYRTGRDGSIRVALQLNTAIFLEVTKG